MQREITWNRMQEVIQNTLEVLLEPEQKHWAAYAARDIVTDLSKEVNGGGLIYIPSRRIITPWGGFKVTE
jgi:hypothetical protein